jgi:hypothetical protein
MRGLEIIILMICIVLALPLVAVIMPAYNGGNGMDTGANDLSSVNAFNWTNLEKYKPEPNANILSQANYFFQLGVMAITGVATIIFSSLLLAPSLLNIFFVNPILAGVLLSALAIVILLTWLQIAKSDDWSGRR